MFVGIFLLVDFFLMLVMGLPLVFSISTAVFFMIIAFAGQMPLTFDSITLAVSNAMINNNTGITIALFLISGDRKSVV